MEKLIKPVSGFLILLLSFAGIGLGIYLMSIGINKEEVPFLEFWIGVPVVLLSAFFLKGLTIVNPNQSYVCTFFGKYAGTIKQSGLVFVNPFFAKHPPNHWQKPTFPKSYKLLYQKTLILYYNKNPIVIFIVIIDAPYHC